MAVLSGKLGAVDGVAAVTNWSVSYSEPSNTTHHSGSQRGPHLSRGVASWTGSYTAQGWPSAKLPVDTLTFTGSQDGTNGVTGAAVVSSVSSTFDFAALAPIEHTVNIQGNGALTFGAAAAADSTVTLPTTVRGGSIQISTNLAVPDYTAIGNVSTATLSMSATVNTYSNSSTSGNTAAIGDVLQECTLSVTLDDADLTVFPSIGTDVLLRLYVSATEYYEFTTMRRESHDTTTPIPAALLNQSATFRFNGAADISGTPTIGSIKLPDTTTYWPFS